MYESDSLHFPIHGIVISCCTREQVWSYTVKQRRWTLKDTMQQASSVQNWRQHPGINLLKVRILPIELCKIMELFTTQHRKHHRLRRQSLNPSNIRLTVCICMCAYLTVCRSEDVQSTAHILHALSSLHSPACLRAAKISSRGGRPVTSIRYLAHTPYTAFAMVATGSYLVTA